MRDCKLKDIYIDYSISTKFDYNILTQYLFLPIEENELFIKIATTLLSNIDLIQSISHKLIKPVIFEEKELLFELNHLKIKQNLFNISEQIMKNSSKENLVNIFIQNIVAFAIEKHGSDIHLENTSTSFSCKIRVDGVLINFFKFDSTLAPIISSILKLYSNLDITQRRLPQNGRFTLTELNDYDFRISTMPTINGESIVIRILQKNFDKFDLSKIGFNDIALEIIKQKISLSSGMILVTGPTGSGKTTTLYSIIKELKQTNKKIITIEDPVEYKIDDITQISLNYELNLTYSEILKNILRQDPDILLIGEIRDALSLKSAITAAMTGHLVLATLHTNDAISTIHRLLDLESESFLIASVLKCVIAQRLVRILCQHCNNSNQTGCKECNNTGFKSRTIISEVLDISNDFSNLISKKATYNEMYENAINSGFTTIYQDGLNKISKNITTKDELLFAIQS
ncbi:GspE/PulE family protein [Arcobacter sp. FWKO B]|uniref:GspE/PulE family protein n=1 Tax=Arcobacter sp. FWKO B TaxID=2593672 RepID=UPI0018A37E85|nr:GspE/PulE family protein [Arcobacter sp. FWKO B]QOG12574.1 type II/IV secretion system protein [Arcobacter sp. FWKO B]